jgi:hypothetical protein
MLMTPTPALASSIIQLAAECSPQPATCAVVDSAFAGLPPDGAVYSRASFSPRYRSSSAAIFTCAT